MINDMYELEHILFNLAFEAKELYETYEENKIVLTTYKEDLNNGKVTKEVRKYFHDRYNLDIDIKNLAKYVKVLDNDIFILEEKSKIVYKRKEKLFKTSKVLRSYEYISIEDINVIKDELIKLGIDSKELITIIEKIKIHNYHLTKKEKNYQHSVKIHQFLDMFQFGYEKIPLDHGIHNKEKLDREVKNIIELLMNNTFQIVEDNLNLEKYYSYNEQKYIYGKLLRYYQTKMQKIVELLVKETEYYFDDELLIQSNNDYFKYLGRYLYIRKLFDNVKKMDYSEDEEITEEEFYGNKLYYSSNSDDPSKCYFVKDLMNIREEALSTIQELLNNFKEGSLNNTKKLTTGALELRYDQVRIILKRLKGNCYSVLGVFIKKSDNLHDIYEMVVNRDDAVIDDDYSNKVEEYYNEYIDNNKRKGSR